jgi:hypothetical protein
MTLEGVPNPTFGVIYAIATTVLGLFLFRGAHTFYHNLKIYHKIPADYDAVVAYKGEPPRDQSVKDFVTNDELRQDGDPDIRRYDQLANGKDPEVILDFNEGKRELYGEPPFRKGAYLAFYLGVASLVPAAIVGFYFTLLPEITSLEKNDFWGAIGALLMIIALHLGIRIATLADSFTYSEKKLREQLQNSLHEFAFSFFMSLYTLWAFTIVIVGFTSGFSSSAFAFEPRLIAVFGLLLFFLPILAAIISYYILRQAEIPGDLMKDYKKTENIIDCQDDSE